jgi:fucose permease
MCLDIRHYKANRKYLQSYSNVVTFIFIVLHYVYVIVSTYFKPTKLIHQNRAVHKEYTDTQLIKECRLLKESKHSLVLTIYRHCYLSATDIPLKLCILNFNAEIAATFNAFIRKMGWLERRPF